MKKPAYTPLKLSLFWLVGTFVAFLTLGEVGKVNDLFKLTAFVSITTGAFAFGYLARVKTWQAPFDSLPELVSDHEAKKIRRWVAASAIYLAAFGLALLSANGFTSPGSILDSILSPGDAYLRRFRDETMSETSAPVQLLTLLGALSTPLVPFMVLFWKQMTPGLKVLGLIGFTLYSTYWLAIGTQKGLGDFAAYAGIALLVKGATTGKRMGRRGKWGLVLLGVLFAVYMVVNQTDRLASAKSESVWATSPVVESMFGRDIAMGVATTVGYPTHGYLGLSYNLESPFVWTKFRGASRALDSYWVQYLDGKSVAESVYPYRTEQLTGWPWDTYWSTIYPWLASDLSFYGVPPFMTLVGWWMARLWLESVHYRNRLSLLLLGQIAILIAYVPANNQIGITRPNLIAFVTIAALYALSRKPHKRGEDGVVPRTSRSSSSV